MEDKAKQTLVYLDESNQRMEDNNSLKLPKHIPENMDVLTDPLRLLLKKTLSKQVFIQMHEKIDEGKQSLEQFKSTWTEDFQLIRGAIKVIMTEMEKVIEEYNKNTINLEEVELSLKKIGSQTKEVKNIELTSININRTALEQKMDEIEKFIPVMIQDKEKVEVFQREMEKMIEIISDSLKLIADEKKKLSEEWVEIMTIFSQGVTKYTDLLEEMGIRK